MSENNSYTLKFKYYSAVSLQVVCETVISGSIYSFLSQTILPYIEWFDMEYLQYEDTNVRSGAVLILYKGTLLYMPSMFISGSQIHKQ